MTEIEVLYFDGCPSYLQAWNDIAKVIVAEKLDAAVKLINVETLEQANTLHFAGSPTIKVNGRDLEDYEGMGVMACRVYQENHGKGWPSLDLIKRQLLATKESNRAKL
jgi:hypothetical protein